MAAVIQLHPLDDRTDRRLASDDQRSRSAHPSNRRPSGPPLLRVVEGGRSPHVMRMQRVYLVRRTLALAAVAVLGLLVVTIGGAVLSEWSKGEPRAAIAPLSSPYQVQEGDTLWGIARSVAPDRDPRDVVEHITRVNASNGLDLRAGSLQVGQELTLPT